MPPARKYSQYLDVPTPYARTTRSKTARPETGFSDPQSSSARSSNTGPVRPGPSPKPSTLKKRKRTTRDEPEDPPRPAKRIHRSRQLRDEFVDEDGNHVPDPACNNGDYKRWQELCKEELIEKVIGHTLVRCKRCYKDVVLSYRSPYDYQHWAMHRQRCLNWSDEELKNRQAKALAERKAKTSMTPPTTVVRAPTPATPALVSDYSSEETDTSLRTPGLSSSPQPQPITSSSCLAPPIPTTPLPPPCALPVDLNLLAMVASTASKIFDTRADTLASFPTRSVSTVPPTPSALLVPLATSVPFAAPAASVTSSNLSDRNLLQTFNGCQYSYVVPMPPQLSLGPHELGPGMKLSPAHWTEEDSWDGDDEDDEDENNGIVIPSDSTPPVSEPVRNVQANNVHVNSTPVDGVPDRLLCGCGPCRRAYVT